MTSDRLDRIDLLLHKARYVSGVSENYHEVLELISSELRYLHNRPPAQQVLDSGQELLKEQN